MRSGRFAVEPAPSGARGTPAASASPQPVRNPRLLGAAPRAAVFAGPQSAEGIATRYCTASVCGVRPGGRPRYVEAPSGGMILFSLGEEPAEAGLEVRPASGGPATRVPLTPGTLMTFGSSLAPGRYLVTLVARFAAAEGSWLFGLVVEA